MQDNAQLIPAKSPTPKSPADWTEARCCDAMRVFDLTPEHIIFLSSLASRLVPRRGLEPFIAPVRQVLDSRSAMPAVNTQNSSFVYQLCTRVSLPFFDLVAKGGSYLPSNQLVGRQKRIKWRREGACGGALRRRVDSPRRLQRRRSCNLRPSGLEVAIRCEGRGAICPLVRLDPESQRRSLVHSLTKRMARIILPLPCWSKLTPGVMIPPPATVHPLRRCVQRCSLDCPEFSCSGRRTTGTSVNPAVSSRWWQRPVPALRAGSPPLRPACVSERASACARAVRNAHEACHRLLNLLRHAVGKVGHGRIIGEVVTASIGSVGRATGQTFGCDEATRRFHD